MGGRGVCVEGTGCAYVLRMFVFVSVSVCLSVLCLCTPMISFACLSTCIGVGLWMYPCL